MILPLLLAAACMPLPSLAQLIEDETGNFKSFLDVGTGSGILSIVAGNSGAEKILAVDFDEKAIITAKRNFRLNKVQGACLKKGDILAFPIKDRYDFVAANLLTEELILAKKAVIGFVKPEYYLVVSGVSLLNLNRFRKVFEAKSRLRLLKLKQKRGWVALLYEKRNHLTKHPKKV